MQKYLYGNSKRKKNPKRNTVVNKSHSLHNVKNTIHEVMPVHVKILLKVHKGPATDIKWIQHSPKCMAIITAEYAQMLDWKSQEANAINQL